MYSYPFNDLRNKEKEAQIRNIQSQRKIRYESRFNNKMPCISDRSFFMLFGVSCNNLCAFVAII